MKNNSSSFATKIKKIILFFSFLLKTKRSPFQLFFVLGGSCLYIFTELAPLVQKGNKKLLSLASILMKTVLIATFFFSSFRPIFVFLMLMKQYVFLFLAIYYFYINSASCLHIYINWTYVNTC